MKGNLYQHIKIRHAYDFSLCFPHELLMSFFVVFNKREVVFYQSTKVAPSTFCTLIKHVLRVY